MRLACWFRRRAETCVRLGVVNLGCYQITRRVRECEDALAITRDATR